MRPELAVLIPAWNERENLERLIPALQEVLGKLRTRAEIIVIDGGSQDGTAERAPGVGRSCSVLLQNEPGYGGDLAHRIFRDLGIVHRHDGCRLIASAGLH